jgi:malonate transporter and related proteins
VGLVTGFATLVAIIGVGALLAQLHIVDAQAQRVLVEVTFHAATPALMLVTIAEVEIDRHLAGNLLASLVSLLTAGGAFLLLARLRWRWSAEDALIGGLSSGYVNAGNLGIAVAAYVVGDTAVVVPTLLVQLLCIQPLALAFLDARVRRTRRYGELGWRLASNPLTVGSAVGLALALTGSKLPGLVAAPVEMLAGMAIPTMLLAYGIALRTSPRPRLAGKAVVTASTLKLAVQPVVAWAVGSAWGVSDAVLLGVVLTAGLPTAQNIFLHATRYRRGETVARETVLLTTVLSLPCALVIALLLR